MMKNGQIKQWPSCYLSSLPIMDMLAWIRYAKRHSLLRFKHTTPKQKAISIIIFSNRVQTVPVGQMRFTCSNPLLPKLSNYIKIKLKKSATVFGRLDILKKKKKKFKRIDQLIKHNKNELLYMDMVVTVLKTRMKSMKYRIIHAFNPVNFLLLFFIIFCISW